MRIRAITRGFAFAVPRCAAPVPRITRKCSLTSGFNRRGISRKIRARILIIFIKIPRDLINATNTQASSIAFVYAISSAFARGLT